MCIQYVCTLLSYINKMAAEDFGDVSLVQILDAMTRGAAVDASNGDINKSFEAKEHFETKNDLEVGEDLEAELRALPMTGSSFRRGFVSERRPFVTDNTIRRKSIAAASQLPQRAKPSSFSTLGTKARVQAVPVPTVDEEEYMEDDEYDYYDYSSLPLGSTNEKPGNFGTTNKRLVAAGLTGSRYVGLANQKFGTVGLAGGRNFGSTNGNLGLGSRSGAIGGSGPRYPAGGYLDYGRYLGRIFRCTYFCSLSNLVIKQKQPTSHLYFCSQHNSRKVRP